MGLIGQIFGLLFGGDRNVVKETAEVFRENAEAGAARGQQIQMTAMAQHGAEFSRANKGRFDRFMDGLNRLPRPALALGTLGLIGSAMTSPDWFAERMVGLAVVPEPLWWLLGVIVSFYFGARHQMKSQDFQRSIAEGLTQGVPLYVQAQEAIREMRHDSPGAADPGTDSEVSLQAVEPSENPPLDQWKAGV